MKNNSNGEEPLAALDHLISGIGGGDGEGEREGKGEGLGDLKSLLQGSDTMTSSQKLGVLQRIVTAVAEDEGYRQILLTAAFDNRQEAMLASDAISERKRYGVAIQPILDRLLAQCSVRSGRVNAVLDALTHYQVHTTMSGKGDKLASKH